MSLKSKRISYQGKKMSIESTPMCLIYFPSRLVKSLQTCHLYKPLLIVPLANTELKARLVTPTLLQ